VYEDGEEDGGGALEEGIWVLDGVGAERLLLLSERADELE